MTHHHHTGKCSVLGPGLNKVSMPKTKTSKLHLMILSYFPHPHLKNCHKNSYHPNKIKPKSMIFLKSNILKHNKLKKEL